MLNSRRANIRTSNQLSRSKIDEYIEARATELLNDMGIRLSPGNLSIVKKKLREVEAYGFSSGTIFGRSEQ